MPTVLNIDRDYLADTILSQIEGSETWEKIEPVVEGWSDEAKYHIFTDAGDELLLRVGDAKRKERNAFIFDILSSASLRGLDAPQPILMGVSKDKTHSYLLLSWLPGDELGNALPTLPVREQYELGRKAGTLLRNIHTLEIKAYPRHHTEDWHEYCLQKANRVITQYRNQEIRSKLIETCIEFTWGNLHHTKDRKQTFQHGDYHVGNLLLQRNDIVGVIDFSRCSIGDPWEDFHRSVWCAEVSPAFASGKVDSYFDDSIPDDLFPLVALYTALTQIGYVTWAQQFAAGEVQTMLRQAHNIDSWYNGFTKTVPSWYT